MLPIERLRNIFMTPIERLRNIFITMPTIVANNRNAAFQFYKCTVDYDDPHKIEHMLCHAIAFKLIKYTELGTLHTIYKINIRGATSF